MRQHIDQDLMYLISRERQDTSYIKNTIYNYLKSRDYKTDNLFTFSSNRVSNNLLDYIREYIRSVISCISNISDESKVRMYDRSYFHMMHRFIIDSSIPDRYYKEELDPRLKLYFISVDNVYLSDITMLEKMMDKSLNYGAQHYYVCDM